MAKKLYIEGNYIIADLDNGDMPKTFATGNSEYNEIGSIFYLAEVEGTERIAIPFNDAGLWEDAATAGTAYTEATLRTFLRANSGFNSAAGGSVADGVSNGDIPVWNATTEEYEPGTDQHIGSANLTISAVTREIVMNSSISTISFKDSTDTNGLLTLKGDGSVWSDGGGGISSSTYYGNECIPTSSGDTGYNQTFFGYQAGQNVDGSGGGAAGGNTGFGSGAGKGLLANSIDAVAVGRNAMLNGGSSYMTAVGAQAMRDVTASGLTSYKGTTALGWQAARYIADGSTALSQSANGLYLGRDSRASAQGKANEIAIGYQAIGNGTNTATIGNSGVSDLYIGTTIHLYQEAALAADSGLSTDGTITTNDTITNAIRSRLNDLESRFQSMGLIP